MGNYKKPYGRVYMTKLCGYIFRRYGLILLLLFAHPVIAMMEGLDQVDFYGLGNSKDKTLIVTFMPDIPIYMISDEKADFTPKEAVRGINQIYNSGCLPRGQPEGIPTLFERFSWADMFTFSARLADCLPIVLRGIADHDLQFAPEDPLFGRVSDYTFRYNRHQTLTLDTMRVIRLIFLQQGAVRESEIHSIYIDLHAGILEQNRPGHIPFVVHAVRFYRGNQLFDGYRTQENIAACKQTVEQKKTKRKDDGDQSQKEPEPPSKKDPPEGSGKKRKTGSSNRNWNFSSGWGGGGNACSMIQFFIATALLSIPSGQKVLFYPDKT